MRRKLSLAFLILAVSVTGFLLLRSVFAPPLKVTMILSGSATDGSFGAQAVAGLHRAQETLNVKTEYLECGNSPLNHLPNLAAAAARSDFIICVGSPLSEHLTAAAEANPRLKFAIIDGIASAPNIVSVFFRANESSYLAGALAAELTPPNQPVGIVIGCALPIMKDVQTGFEAGAKSVRPDVQILTDVVGSWQDPAGGARCALSQRERGAHVIFQAAGGSGIGVIESAAKGQFLAIGCDMPQDSLAPCCVPASAVKRADTVVCDLIKAATQNTLPLGKILSLGINEGAVGLEWNTQPGNAIVPAEVKARINALSSAVRSGELKVPSAF
ncbi:MAG: BMP family ABC transporter substrate-binding protein [Pyramidobacter sp.]|nr:BMP family ABC transporter substrate-binding protein [Pyramidobacter sp.]